MMKNAKAGFTLAEVLTTLMVIGVVAALTIPSLLNSTGDQQARAATKKAMSVLAQAVQMIGARGDELNCNFSTNQANNGAELAACFANVLNGTRDGASITTNDGMVFRFIAPQNALAAATGSIDTLCGTVPNGVAYGNCGVQVDTNGPSRGDNLPNAAPVIGNSGWGSNPENGRDVVSFAIASTGVTCSLYNGGNNHCAEFIRNISAADAQALGGNIKLCCTGSGADAPQTCNGGADNGKYICTPHAADNTCLDTETDVTTTGAVSQCAN